jgi:glycosyltransferase involved in cell wall biosynthesis
MKKMRILHVIPYLNPSRGGDVSVVHSLTKQLVDNGHQCCIITTDFEFDPKYAKSLEEIGVKIIPFHCIVNIKLFLISPSMKSWLKTNIINFDLIHMHDLRSYQNNVACVYAQKHNIPYVLQPHGSTPRVMGKIGLKWLYDMAFGYRLIKGASHVIAVSNEEAEYDRSMIGRNGTISVIYNGMDMGGVHNSVSQGDFKKKNNISGKMILYIGRLHKSKGIDYALQAFFALCYEIEGLIFVIAGADDGYKSTLENIVSKSEMGERVRFLGAISEKDKLSAYSDAVLFIHTVRYMGGVGIAPLEAILNDVPVIVTDECGEIIKATNIGYVVKYGDIDALKMKMKYILEYPKESQEMVAIGKRYIIDNLPWAKVVSKIERIYDDCIRKTEFQ